MKIQVISHDITKLGPEVDCIVNAANESLLGGGGVDGAIHYAAGPRLLEECRQLGGCKPGEAKATKAYDLPQKYIIHTVGPRYYSNPNPAKTLENCYLNSLKLADELGCKSVAFPSISTGIFGYPVREAAAICAKAVASYEPKNLEQAYMCAFPGDSRTFTAYSEAIAHL